MKHYLNGLLLSISYFSILPVPKKEITMNKEVYDGMLFSLPFLGFILALISVGAFTFLSGFMPLEYSAFLCATLYLILYGFLHLEAVCDVIDGWFAQLSGKDVYAIMKEPHVGAVGAIGTFVLVVLKVGVITTLLLHSSAAVFLAAVIFSRMGLVFGLNWFEFHEQSTFAQALKKSAKGRVLLVMLFVYILISYFAIDFSHVVLFSVLTFVLFAVVLTILKKKFGFLNGDCLGFSLEIVELCLLNLGLVLL